MSEYATDFPDIEATPHRLFAELENIEEQARKDERMKVRNEFIQAIYKESDKLTDEHISASDIRSLSVVDVSQQSVSNIVRYGGNTKSDRPNAPGHRAGEGQ